MRFIISRSLITSADSFQIKSHFQVPRIWMWTYILGAIRWMVFPVVMYGCESWTIKKVECWVDAFKLWMLEMTLESPLESEEIKPVHPEGNQPWIFIGRTDAEAEAPILWPPDVKRGLIGKDPNAGKDWGQEEKGWQMMRWLNGMSSLTQWPWVCEQTPGDGEGQGSLACYSPWACKELDTT